MPKYVAQPAQRFGDLSRIVREDQRGTSIIYAANQLGSCGLGSLNGFYTCENFTSWQDEAEWISCLYRTLYCPAILIYCLTQNQLKNAGHQALLKIGSVQVTEFPNLTHGPNMQYLFKVNIRNAVGRYCNKYGEAYTEPPKDESEVLPERTTPITWEEAQFLPTREKK